MCIRDRCFDYDTYISEAMIGEGVRNNGPIILNMLGYNPDLSLIHISEPTRPY